MSTVQVSMQSGACGCCEGLSAETPMVVANRPGLSAIAYRVGTYAQFLSSLHAGLSDSDPVRKPLQDLTTRTGDDFSLALLDAFAAMADVLTFYQERTANESYLRTSTERFSVQHLAELIGYQLRPGVAAGTYLAFTIETAEGAPHETTVDTGVKVQSVPGPGEKPQLYETVEKILARAEWNELTPVQTEKRVPGPGDVYTYLNGTTTNLKVGDPVLIVGGPLDVKNPPFADPVVNEQWEFRTITEVVPDPDAHRTRIAWSRALGDNRLKTASPEGPPSIYALRTRASLFGNNAPDPKMLATDTVNNFGEKISKKTPTNGLEWQFNPAGPTTYLESVHERIPATVEQPAHQNSWCVMVKSDPHYVELFRITRVGEEAKTDYGLSAKVTRLDLEGENWQFFLPPTTTVYAQSEKLDPAEYPRTDEVAGSIVELDRAIPGLEKGRTVLLTGVTAQGDTNTEVLSIDSVTPAGAGSELVLTKSLKEMYNRNSVKIFANVAAATHGDTVQETLGGGDPAQPFQKFALLQPPLTYTSAATETGIASSLQISVNDIRWHEVPMLYDRGPHEHVFVAHLEDNGKTTVEFGDGKNGARLPSGAENVRATYRKGIGLSGIVKAQQLSMLLTRPLGVKSVTNPLPGTGADDAETLEAVRSNAPLTVLTLGRIVSLNDYTDFARAFPGIAKAFATWTWNGRSYGIFITVAGPKGTAVTPESDTYVNLLKAIGTFSDPHVPVTVQSYVDARVWIAARVKIHPDYQQDNVLAAVRQALLDTFSFDQRMIGQPLFLSEAIATIQDTEGVLAVDIDGFEKRELLSTHGGILTFSPFARPFWVPWMKKAAYERVPHRLLAGLPHLASGGEMSAAQLITIDPDSLSHITVMS